MNETELENRIKKLELVVIALVISMPLHQSGEQAIILKYLKEGD